ncbi:MAG: GTP cyclohydrolase II [Actinomycetota bacterium]|nr:GTP cyclohydrolase II [Actinomycetota bacterium]
MVAEFSPVSRVTHVATTRIPTGHAEFVAHAFRDEHTGDEHVVLALGDLDDLGAGPPLVRLHSECLTGDALGSRRCDCGDQLQAAQAAIAAEGRGAIVYIRGHEGRGIGLSDKLRAYALQDRGLDTLEANVALGLPVDAREYSAAVAMLSHLGVSAVRLLSSNPAKEAGLRALGMEVSRTGLRVPPRPDNLGYLRTKYERMGHDAVTTEDEWSELLAGRVPVVGELAARYGPLVAAGPRLVLAQLGQSLDGFIASRTGDACFVTGAADRTHLHRLRAVVDAVVVGVGTVAADDCRLTVRAVPGPSPVRVVLDPRARVPRDAHVLVVDDAPTLWVVADDIDAPTAPAPHVQVLRLPRTCAERGFAPAQVLAVLAARGLGRVLVEGGGLTVSGFLQADVLDRLLVTTAPLLVGDGVPGLRFQGRDRLAEALRAPSRRFLLGDDVCVELDLTGPATQSTVWPVGHQYEKSGQH